LANFCAILPLVFFPICDILFIEREGNTMMRIRAFVWFFVLNCCVNSLIKEPTDYWWLIEIIIVIISLIMVVDKK
jgi:hypothetical protein